MLLASPAIALEGNELSEGAAIIFDPSVHEQEAQQSEHQNYGENREPVLDGCPAPALPRRLVDIRVAAADVGPAVIVLPAFIEFRLRHDMQGHST